MWSSEGVTALYLNACVHHLPDEYLCGLHGYTYCSEGRQFIKMIDRCSIGGTWSTKEAGEFQPLPYKNIFIVKKRKIRVCIVTFKRSRKVEGVTVSESNNQSNSSHLSVETGGGFQFPSVSSAGRIIQIIHSFVSSVTFPVQCRLAVNHVMHSSHNNITL